MEQEHDSHAAMRHAVAEAVAEGIKAAASDPELWALALKAMQERAAASTGNFVLEAFGQLWRRLMWVAIITLGLYALGGPGAIVAAIKAYGVTK